MADYQTDEEKVEAIKQWWRENGTSVVVGVVVGLGLIFGWRAWQGYQNNQAQQASATFEQLLAVANREETEPSSVYRLAERLRTDYASTPYAALAALVEARVALANADHNGAKQALERAKAEAPDPAIATIAALRLARILIAEEDLAGAQAIIAEQPDTGPFSGELAALRGDLAVAEGRPDEARAAYQEAIANGASQADLIRMKLADLPVSG